MMPATSKPRRPIVSAPWLLSGLMVLLACPASRGSGPGPFAQFRLPDTWEARFWDDPDTKVLLRLDPKALADLVPIQAGLRFCRCPACDADEASDPLVWSATRPKTLTCSRCGQTFPNDKVPAQVDKKVPEELIEVLPGLTHHYPYHAVPTESQRYADERLFLEAKRDYERREALSKAALYAAVRHHEHPQAGKKDGDLARFAAILILRFAQVYPAYATHFDQPGQPKFLQTADLAPPYRRGYRTGKWEWTASLDVPLNLVTAYALIRDEPIWAEVGKLLDDPNPRRTIEIGFFRASADFVRRQPEEYDEMSLQAYRGLFAVGRLLDDATLIAEARDRLARFAERGFYHDGYWRQGNGPAHRRVLAQLDGWIERLAADAVDPEGAGAGPASTPRWSVPMLDLARAAGSTGLGETVPAEILQAAWPSSPAPSSAARRPGLLGGVGLARLSVGGETDGLDLELRGMGSLGSPHFQRQALRVAVGGKSVLDDLDDLPATRDGWDLATASHNTVVVDGLNQRETPTAAREVVPGGQFLFFAADPDFQVVALDDPLAYPGSTTRYRQVVVAASGPKARYAVSVFQVFGGLQHDQLFHGPAGRADRWSSSSRMTEGVGSLLPNSIPYVPNTSADDGRWFVQAYGEFRRLARGISSAPSTATLAGKGRPGVRLHLLGDTPLTLFSALTPDPTLSKSAAPAAEGDEGRASLVVRRRSTDGSTLNSTFVTVFDPIGVGPSLRRVGRVASTGDTVVVYLETADGEEHLVVNLRPGTSQTVQLANGHTATTDGLALRVGPDCLQLAGGTVGRSGPIELRQERLTGRLLAVSRVGRAGSRGWFEVEGAVDRLAGEAGRTLLLRHGDGSVRGWTIAGVEAAGAKVARLYVREEPGFSLDVATSEARYYQFPRSIVAGPHTYSISRLARGGEALR